MFARVSRIVNQLNQENQLICLEDLNVSGLLNSRPFSRAISTGQNGEFRVLCEAKSAGTSPTQEFC